MSGIDVWSLRSLLIASKTGKEAEVLLPIESLIPLKFNRIHLSQIIIKVYVQYVIDARGI